MQAFLLSGMHLLLSLCIHAYWVVLLHTCKDESSDPFSSQTEFLLETTSLVLLHDVYLNTYKIFLNSVQWKNGYSTTKVHYFLSWQKIDKSSVATNHLSNDCEVTWIALTLNWKALEGKNVFSLLPTSSPFCTTT